jgi:hydroxymethylglutaryl-CoA synthase
MVGIVGYGAYIPRGRVKVETIAEVWGADAPSYKKGLMLHEKSVPSPDQDTLTMAVEAARKALRRAGNPDPQRIGCVYVGSESHAYAVKPDGTILAEALGATPHCHTADLEFACKAGTEGMYLAYTQVKAGEVDLGLGVGGDTSQGAPGDALEYSASAGAAAFLFGSDEKMFIATIDGQFSYMTDTPDFWRREHEFYPQHAGRFTGEPAYFKHTLGGAQGMMDKMNLKPSDFAYAIFHQPNGKFPQRAGKMLGFSKEQLEPGWLSPWLGNTYSGASPIGLTATLDIARPGDRILICSYGSGAGSDAFVLTVTKRIDEVRNLAEHTRPQLDEKKRYLTYGEYAKFRRKIRKATQV